MQEYLQQRARDLDRMWKLGEEYLAHQAQLYLAESKALKERLERLNSWTGSPYWDNALSMIFLGKYSGYDPNASGVGGSILLGIFGVDFPKDAADVIHDFHHFEGTWGHIGELTVDVAAVLPVIGAIKNVKHGFDLRHAKSLKWMNMAADHGGDFSRYADDVFRLGDDIIGRGPRSVLPLTSRAPAKIIERHHQLPKQFAAEFKRAGLNMEDFTIPLERAKHRLRPGGLHTGPENWNAQWKQFFAKNPNAQAPEILEQLAKMRKAFGLE